tara:strand:+ start:178 stop:582 length:405 start_codon:yes stop_codon:yes gene_type:complete
MDTKFTEAEKLRVYNIIGKLKLSFPIAPCNAVDLYWRKGMLDRDRLARLYALKRKVCVAEGMKGFDLRLDADEIKSVIPQVVHELRHLYIAIHNPVIYQLTKAIPSYQHKHMGVYKCEAEANDQLGRQGASQIN